MNAERIDDPCRQWADLLEIYSMGDTALFAPDVAASLAVCVWPPNQPEKDAASLLHLELTSRIATQPLAYGSGDPVAALQSIFALFARTREICQHNLAAAAFERIAWHVLNIHVRPFTAYWHKRSEAGELWAIDETDEFRADLAIVQQVLRQFDAVLLHVRDGDAPHARELPKVGDDRVEVEMRRVVQASTGMPSRDDEARYTEARRKHYGLSVPSGLTGLALSGGGIRSATFSLGVLTALARRGILPQVDYLSTVSGGGYFGAFLTNFLATSEPAAQVGLRVGDQPFGNDADRSQALGHIRQNCRYLMSGPTWRSLQIAVAQFGGLLINILALAALAGLIGAFISWVGDYAYSASVTLTGGIVALLVISPSLNGGTSGVIGVIELFCMAAVLVSPAASIGRMAERFANSVFLALGALLALLILHVALEFVQNSLCSLIVNRKVGIALVFAAPVGLLAFGTVLERMVPFGKAIPRFVARAAAALFVGMVFISSLALMAAPGRLPIGLAWIALLPLLIAATLNINFTGLHRHYRDRLAKTFLIRSTGPQYPICVKADTRLSQLSANVRAPYPIINAALNVPSSRDSRMNGRAVDFFSFTPHQCGSRLVGYAPTETWERYNPQLDLATAMAVSGAAISPQSGLTTAAPLSFWLALLNARLDLWVRNPLNPGIMPFPGLRYLIAELTGRIAEASPFLNLSDGGHVENLGAYELLVRRCKYVIVVDGEQDGQMTFQAMANLQRLALTDLKIRIEINLDDLRRKPEGVSRSHFQFGRIRYPNGDIGYLIYLKLSLTGNEGEFLRRFKLDEPDFPHRPTADQNFTEARFEAYRCLGEHVGEKLFLSSIIGDLGNDSETTPLESWFLAIGQSYLRPV